MKVKRNLTKNGKHRIELIFDDTQEMDDFSNAAYNAYEVADGGNAEALLDLLSTSSYGLASFVPFDQSTRDRLNIKGEFPE